jgi:adenylate kinase family enzyme
MDRIAIIGRSGGGKSRLTRALGAALGLPVVHLDVVFWRPGWVESDDASFRQRLGAALAGGRWITDGNFMRMADLHIAGAELIVWVDQPRMLCVRRALWRAITERGGKRADMAEGCDEKFDPEFYRYIWNWDRDTRPRVEAAIARFAPETPVVSLKSDAEIEAFLARTAAGPATLSQPLPQAGEGV